MRPLSYAAALLLAGCLAPAESSSPADPEEYYEHRRQVAVSQGAFCMGDAACEARAQAERMHAEQQLQAHREAEATREALERAAPAGQDAPQWWCYEVPGTTRGACERTAAECGERLVKDSEGLTKFDTRCAPRPVAFCISATHHETFKQKVVCLPTAEGCAMTRLAAEKSETEWAVSPKCEELKR